MEILSDRRFVEVTKLLQKNGFALSEENSRCLANAFEIISTFVHGKLTNEEIFRTYDLLSDVMKNDRPDIIAHVNKEDRIRVAVRLMEELQDTRGKLTEDEKIAFAFCIFTGECTQIYDEEQGVVRSGVALFDSFEHIEQELLYAMKTDPTRFDMRGNRVVIDEQYGYSVDAAIQTTSVRAAYAYLQHLKYNGKPIIYSRIGSFSNSTGQLVDGYTIYTEKKGLFSTKKVEVATLYINSYCESMPRVAPKGFSLD